MMSLSRLYHGHLVVIEAVVKWLYIRHGGVAMTESTMMTVMTILGKREVPGAGNWMILGRRSIAQAGNVVVAGGAGAGTTAGTTVDGLFSEVLSTRLLSLEMFLNGSGHWHEMISPYALFSRVNECILSVPLRRRPFQNGPRKIKEPLSSSRSHCFSFPHRRSSFSA
jgi:hypothetical protein